MSKLDTMIYMVTASLQINKKVYSVSLSKQPITVQHELAYLGNTSFKLKCDIFFPDHPESLISGEQMCVLVDQDTRRPSAPPTWWSQELKGDIDKSGQPFKFISTPMPTDFAEEKIAVNPSDVDFYLHAGSANYIKFMTDAYTRWHVKKFGLQNNPFRNVKNMAQSFKGEAELGNILTVRFWPNKDNKDLFHFHLSKNENVVHECDIEFFSIDSS